MKFFVIIFFIMGHVFALKATEQESNEKLECQLNFPIGKEWVKKHYKKRNENEDMKLCVIINNFGMNNKVTRSILRIIPKEFSIAISPYQKLQKNSLDYIKREGHEELYIQPVMPYRETHSTQDPYRMYMEY
ncbi:MAG: hypothetical protein KBD31_04865, partial [Proteobacteria bacterium]|nr:hypothetical protein [Pseudomonadota bacterium]